MKFQICQMQCKAGHPAINAKKILKTIEKAKEEKIDLLILPELCLSGYLIGDMWEMPDFVNDCLYWGEKIKEASKNISIIFGNIAIDPTKKNEDGRVRKYNAFYFAENQKFLTPQSFPYPFTIKTLLPNYREFEDSRYFFSMQQLASESKISIEDLLSPFSSRLGNFACILCEDGWDTDYHISPLQILASKNIDAIINISCSPFTLFKNEKRIRNFSAQAKKYKKPIIYVNTVGIQNNGKTIFTFDGQSAVFSNQGLITQLPAFAESIKTFEINSFEKLNIENKLHKEPSEIQQIFQALQFGTKTFLQQIGVEKIVIGLSGGIDSAVAAALYATFIKPENLLLINMPSEYNSHLTKNLAQTLANNLNCLYAEIPIQNSVELTKKELNGLTITSYDKKIQITLKLESFVLENIQARDRSSRILAAIAAAFGGAFTTNANKTESTIGYSTLYGDHAGFLANLADLWKYQVYALGRYLNSEVFHKEIIPEGIFTIKPSAELSEKQDITKGLGDPLQYEYHDRLFKSWVENWHRPTPETILSWFLNSSLEKELGLLQPLSKYFASPEEFINDLEKWWKLYQGMAIAKRIQAPPILAISKRAYGLDHRDSQCGAYFTTNYFALKEKIISSQKWIS